LERFLAGPRDLLAPLIESPACRDYLAQHPAPLVHGPMLGVMTDNSVNVWVRTADESQVTVRVFDNDDTESPVQPVQIATASSSQQSDYTAVIAVSNLKPDTRYFYDARIGNTLVDNGSRHEFRTFPPAGAPARFHIAYGGCAGFTPMYERMWDTIAKFHPLAMLLLGDNVYIDLPQEAGPLHRYTMYQRQSRPEFRRLVATTPIYAIWDDHDAAVDDIWLGPYRDKPAWKPSMLTLFKQNWNNPAYGHSEWPACWFKFSIGDVDVFMLDCRYYRTNPFADRRTMLGPTQKSWLLSELKKSRATFKIIASSVPWAHEAKPGKRDTWDGFPEEREEIFSSIEKNDIDGVVLLSADRHRSDVRKISRPNGYPLYDLLNSRLTNIEVAPLLPGAIFAYNDKCSFGLLTFDTKNADPQITFEIVNIDGQSVHALTIRRNDLTSPASR
jgi:alkaline phosphatase D